MSQQGPKQSSQQPAEKPSSSPVLLIILVVVLVLGIIAVAYDRLMARPSSEKAYEVVNGLIDKRIGSPANALPVTNEDVHKELNRKPNRTNTTQHYTEEVYSWRRGLLLLSYNLYVIYTKDKQGRLELHSCSLNEPPEPEHLPSGPVKLSADVDTSTLGPADPKEAEGGIVRPPGETLETPVTPTEPPGEAPTEPESTPSDAPKEPEKAPNVDP